MTKVHVVMSGSGARFPCYVGALKAMEESGFEIDHAMGTSGGAMILGLYKAGVSLEKLEQLAVDLKFSKYVSLSLWRLLYARWYGGMNSGRKIEKLIDSVIESIPMSGAGPRLSLSSVPNFWCVVTDIIRQRPVVLRGSEDVPLSRAIRASMSVPVLLTPVEMRGTKYYDGGVTLNFAIDYWQDELLPVHQPPSRPVIGITFDPRYELFKHDSFFSTLKSTVAASMASAQLEHEKDFSGKIVKLATRVQPGDFDVSRARKEEMINDGYEQTMRGIENWL